jgi:putative ABC transport system ATP-binding protein
MALSEVMASEHRRETNRRALEGHVMRTAVTAEPMSPTALAAARTEHAVKIYGTGDTQVRALDDVTVEFAHCQFSAIMGPSGSGKSTLMHCLAGLDTLSAGHAFIGDIDITTLNERQLTLVRRERIGFVFQAYNLVPTLTALENITLPQMLAGLKPDREWLDLVVHTLGLGDRLRHKPSELSGGQQQRVAVARVLASRPTIIFADEPTGNLDSKAGVEILEFMRRAVREFDQTVVIVTHDPNAASYADRVIFLSDGRIVDEMSSPTTPRILDRLKRLD